MTQTVADLGSKITDKPLKILLLVTRLNIGGPAVQVVTLAGGPTIDYAISDIESIGAFLRVEEKLQIPRANRSYSLNEGNRLSFPDGYRDYLAWAQENGYSSRYVGAMVADVHRILLKGGVFLYPPTEKAPNGKLRLMYEANPMAMIIEQAGGKALAGIDDEGEAKRILALDPQNIHERCTVILGSPEEVDHVVRHL